MKITVEVDPKTDKRVYNIDGPIIVLGSEAKTAVNICDVVATICKSFTEPLQLEIDSLKKKMKEVEQTANSSFVRLKEFPQSAS